MTSRPTRSSPSSRKLPRTNKRPRLTSTPSSSRSTVPVSVPPVPANVYRPPTHLLDDELIVPMPDLNVMQRWWYNEYFTIRRSFKEFVERGYFINKFDFLNFYLNNPELKSVGIFMPSGCCKTFMSHTLELFFSYRLTEDEREEVKALYKNVVNDNLIEQHEGQYYVIHLSLRKFPFTPDELFYTTLFYFMKNAMKTTEPGLFEDENIQKLKNSSFLLCGILNWLGKKYEKKFIFIIDEIDYITNMYIHQNVSSTLEDRMKASFNDILTNLSNNKRIERVILFGIHVPNGILRSREWITFDFRDKECAKYFMFSRSEVEDILKRKKMAEKIDAVERHYGNYPHGLFCPASVIAFVMHKGAFSLYKWCRRSCDITDLNLKATESWLAPFADFKIHQKYINTNSYHFVRPIKESDALYQYVFAGLLWMSLPDDRPAVGFYELSAGNLENLNIIAYLLFGKSCKYPFKLRSSRFSYLRIEQSRFQETCERI